MLVCCYARYSFLFYWKRKCNCHALSVPDLIFLPHKQKILFLEIKVLFPSFTGRCDFSHLCAISMNLLLTVQTEGNVDSTDVSDSLEVRDAGALELGGSRGITHIYPADGLICIDEVHSHSLFGRDRVQS